MKNPLHTLGLSLCWLALLLPLSAHSETPPVHSHTLKNGMRILVKEDHRAPTVAHMVWYNVGGMDETEGHTGVAHLLEHMMFKGTPKVGEGQFSKRVAAAGGRDNAFTSHDYTAYFQQIPKESLPGMMALEADRMRHLTLSPKAFEQEIKVVMEERRMRTDDNPQSTLFEQLNAIAFQTHPYRRPVIGWMHDLEAMTVADAREWYQQWYVPNNATLVVVGDVDPKKIVALAERTYGKLAARPLPKRSKDMEPLQRGIRRLSVEAPADLPMLVMAYKAPTLRKPSTERDHYALRILTTILSGNEAARLPQALVREQGIAVSVAADYDFTARGHSLFYLYGSPSPGKTVDQLETALRAQIGRIQTEGVMADELSRAKAQLVSSEVFKRDSMFGQAMEIGQLESAGLSWRDEETLLKGLQAVTADEIQAVAQKFLDDRQLTVGVLKPLPVEGKNK